jgi:hypothetical protein
MLMNHGNDTNVRNELDHQAQLITHELENDRAKGLAFWKPFEFNT